MTNILAIDTSSEACSIAIHANGKTNYFHEISSVKHSERILSIVDELLLDSQIKIDELDLIACGVGPGSFTGIRLSCSITQGLGYSLELPVVGISSLSSIAHQLNKSKDINKICCLVNAHMNQIYVGQYQFMSGKITESLERVVNVSDFSMKSLNLDNSFVILGDGCELINIKTSAIIYPHAKSILELALIEFEQGKQSKPEELKPIYLSGEEHWSKV